MNEPCAYCGETHAETRDGVVICTDCARLCRDVFDAPSFFEVATE